MIIVFWYNGNSWQLAFSRGVLHYLPVLDLPVVPRCDLEDVWAKTVGKRFDLEINSSWKGLFLQQHDFWKEKFLKRKSRENRMFPKGMIPEKDACWKVHIWKDISLQRLALKSACLKMDSSQYPLHLAWIEVMMQQSWKACLNLISLVMNCFPKGMISVHNSSWKGYSC